MNRSGEHVSVVIPYCKSYTPESMLDEAIDSIEAQNVPTTIHVINDEEQRGPGWARNKGLSQATTRYVAFLDADDLWKPQKLSRQLAEMKRTGASLCVEGNSNLSEQEFIHGLLNGDITSLTPSILIDTDDIDAKFRTDLEYFEDHLFMIESAVTGGVCFCDDLVTIRKHDKGVSASGSRHEWAIARRQMAKIIDSEIPAAQTYLNTVEGLAEYALARHSQLNGEYRAAITHAYYSFSLLPTLRPIAVAGLAITGWVRELMDPRLTA